MVTEYRLRPGHFDAVRRVRLPLHLPKRETGYGVKVTPHYLVVETVPGGSETTIFPWSEDTGRIDLRPTVLLRDLASIPTDTNPRADVLYACRAVGGLDWLCGYGLRPRGSPVLLAKVPLPAHNASYVPYVTQDGRAALVMGSYQATLQVYRNVTGVVELSRSGKPLRQIGPMLDGGAGAGSSGKYVLGITAAPQNANPELLLYTRSSRNPALRVLLPPGKTLGLDLSPDGERAVAWVDSNRFVINLADPGYQRLALARPDSSFLPSFGVWVYWRRGVAYYLREAGGYMHVAISRIEAVTIPSPGHPSIIIGSIDLPPSAWSVCPVYR